MLQNFYFCHGNQRPNQCLVCRISWWRWLNNVFCFVIWGVSSWVSRRATLPDITWWVVFFWLDYFRFYFVVSILMCRLQLPLFVCFSHSIGLYTCSVPLVHVRANRDSVEITVTECFIDTLNIDVFPYLCVVSHL